MIIFLDIDGVLVTSKSIHGKKNMSDANHFDPTCVASLNYLTSQLDHPGIVVSSTWRILYKLNPLRELLGQIGVSAPVLDVTGHFGERGEEIKDWLAKYNQGDDYIVIDDEVHDIDQHIPSYHLLHCSGGWFADGLTIAIVDEFMRKRNRKINVTGKSAVRINAGELAKRIDPAVIAKALGATQISGRGHKNNRKR